MFITQDTGKCVSFEDLVIKGGLFDILPELDNDAYMGQLWHWLQQLPHHWYNGEEETITSEEI